MADAAEPPVLVDLSGSEAHAGPGPNGTVHLWAERDGRITYEAFLAADRASVFADDLMVALAETGQWIGTR